MTDPRWDVSRARGLKVTEDGDEVRLISSTETEDAFLANAARMYRILEPSGTTPKLRSHVAGLLVLERIRGSYVADVQWSEMDFFWGCIDLLRALQGAGIKHGDLTAKNLVVRDNRPLAIDFQEAVFVKDAIETKRPESDAEILWQAAIDITGDQDRRLRRWQLLREHVRGLTVDIGANAGHFCALARLDSAATKIFWIDSDPEMRTVAEALDVADQYFVGDATRFNYQSETVLLLSTWAHFIDQIGWDLAIGWLANLIKGADQVLFETQYFGDGPGPKEFQNDLDLLHWVQKVGGKAERLGAIPVHGRLASRTVWRLTSSG